MSHEKRPLLKKLFDELMAQKAPLALEREKVRAELDALTQNPRIAELRAKLKDLNAKLGPMDNELAGLARALGSKSVHAEPGVYTKSELKGA